jgi:hypothetical protein
MPINKSNRNQRLSGWIGLVTFSVLFGLLAIGAVIALIKIGQKLITWIM